MSSINEEINSSSVAVLDSSELEINHSSIATEPRVQIRVKGGKIYAFFKRMFDFFASLIALIVLALPMLIIGIIVKLTSKGPIFFKDQRVGKNGKTIFVYKFRSMYVDAEEKLKEYLSEEQYDQWLIERKIDNDPRITKVGKFLRCSSLDELPQLINILKGDMSFVGSRPITRLELEHNFTEYEANILLSARPGLTGYWQVYGRSNIDYASGERQKLELEYYTKRGFWFDIGLIFKTVPAVLKRKGAK